jgi:hypothetical protein
MKVVLNNVSRKLILAGGITLAATAANAQMKIGDNPSQITKSAILELNSTRQGLLLPRLTDTVAINTTIGTDVVDGMLIYLNDAAVANKGIYVRKNGYWVKIASANDAASNWGLTGNTGTDATNFIGTSDNTPLSIRANSVEAISVQTTGAIQLKQVTATTTDAALEVLVIEANGTIVKKQVPAYAFKNLLTNSDTTNTTFTTTQATDGQVTINAPVMTGNPDRKYGFMTFEDWTRLNDLATGNSLTVANLISGVAAADATKAAQITYNTVTNKYELALIEADATHNGVVTTGAQTLAGNKTFTGATTVNNTLGVTGATTLSNTLGVTGATTLGNTLGVTGATTLGNTLGVTGAATLNNTLEVTGATTLHNGATVTAGDVVVTAGNLNVTAGNATVGGTTTLDGTVTLNSTAASTETNAINVLVQNATSKNIEVKSFSFDAIEKAVTLIKAGAGQTEGGTVEFVAASNGTDFAIEADATAKTVTFSLPNASAVDSLNTAAKRGLVSTGYQSFDGNKSFVDSVSVGKPGLANSTLEVNGSVAMAIRTVTATTAINEKDNTVLVNPSANIDINLPAAATIPGRIYTIKKIGGGLDNAVTIKPAAGTIEGGTSYVIYNDWTFVTIQTDGINWYIIKK